MRTPEPPKRVRVGHRYYSVRYLPEIVIEGVACDGLCCFNESEIWVGCYLTPDSMAETLQHEVLHAIHYEAGLTDTSTEEEFTNLTAKGLCRFYQDNPSAVRWLLHSLKPPKVPPQD